MKARKHLSAGGLFQRVRQGFGKIKEHRFMNIDIRLEVAIVHPDQKAVIPLMPEPIVKQDGEKKNDCERNAAKRLYAGKLTSTRIDKS